MRVWVCEEEGPELRPIFTHVARGRFGATWLAKAGLVRPQSLPHPMPGPLTWVSLCSVHGPVFPVTPCRRAQHVLSEAEGLGLEHAPFFFIPLILKKLTASTHPIATGISGYT